jgi:hypothetical protein
MKTSPLVGLSNPPIKYNNTVIIILSRERIVNTFFLVFLRLHRAFEKLCENATKINAFFLCRLRKIYKIFLVKIAVLLYNKIVNEFFPKNHL